MNKLVRGALVAVIATLVALTAAVPAFAAPVPWEQVEVTMHNESGTAIVLVSGTLPEGTKLPAQVELAVPKGGEFQWAGEILGGAPAADPSVEYTVKEANGMDVYSFTLKQARIGQIEISLPSALAFDGTTYRSALAWTAVTDETAVNMFVRVPTGTQVTEPADGAGMVPGPEGYSYYSRSVKDVKAGTTLDLTFAFTSPAGATATGAAPAPTAPANNTLPMVLIIAFVVGAFALVFIGVKGKMADGSTEPQPVRESASEQRSSTSSKASTPASSKDAAPAAAKGASKAPLIVGLVVVGVIIAGFAAAGTGTAAQKVGGVVVKDFGNQSACSSVPVGITTDDPEKVFAALKDVPGLGKVTVDPAAKSANVEFCVSSTTEQAVTGALSAAGILGQTASPAPATPAPGTPATGAPAPGAPAPAAPASATPFAPAP